MISHSAEVRAAGFMRIRSGTPILPTSCSRHPNRKSSLQARSGSTARASCVASRLTAFRWRLVTVSLASTAAASALDDRAVAPPRLGVQRRVEVDDRPDHVDVDEPVAVDGGLERRQQLPVAGRRGHDRQRAGVEDRAHDGGVGVVVHDDDARVRPGRVEQRDAGDRGVDVAGRRRRARRRQASPRACRTHRPPWRSPPSTASSLPSSTCLRRSSRAVSLPTNVTFLAAHDTSLGVIRNPTGKWCARFECFSAT